MGTGKSGLFYPESEERGTAQEKGNEKKVKNTCILVIGMVNYYRCEK